MLRSVATHALIIAAASFVAPATHAQEHSRIPRSQIEQMFQGMRADAPWDVDGPLLWGYFFTSTDRQALERASGRLVQDGYRLVDIRRADRSGATGGSIWLLHVERVERHTVDSLDSRNQTLYAFAERQGIAYDGMDVGAAP